MDETKIKTVENWFVLVSIVGIVCGSFTAFGNLSEVFNSLPRVYGHLSITDTSTVGTLTLPVIFLVLTSLFGLILNVVGTVSMSKCCIMASGILYTFTACAIASVLVRAWQPYRSDVMTCLASIACPICSYSAYIIARRTEYRLKLDAVLSNKEAEETKPEKIVVMTAPERQTSDCAGKKNDGGNGQNPTMIRSEAVEEAIGSHDINVVALVVNAIKEHPHDSNAAIASIAGVDREIVDSLRDDGEVGCRSPCRK